MRNALLNEFQSFLKQGSCSVTTEMKMMKSISSDFRNGFKGLKGRIKHFKQQCVVFIAVRRKSKCTDKSNEPGHYFKKRPLLMLEPHFGNRCLHCEAFRERKHQQDVFSPLRNDPITHSRMSSEEMKCVAMSLQLA